MVLYGLFCAKNGIKSKVIVSDLETALDISEHTPLCSKQCGSLFTATTPYT